MTLELLIAFLIFALVSSITPGPNNMMCLASGVNYGFRRTIPHIMGIGFGFAFLVFMAGIGLLSLLDYVPILYRVLHIVSATYIVYLAWKIATAAPMDAKSVNKKKPMSFIQAVAFQWVNPKGLVMAMAAITNYVPEEPSEAFFMNVVCVSVLFGLISLFSSSVWVACGTGLRRMLSHPTYYRVFNITMAILLVLTMVPIFVEMWH